MGNKLPADVLTHIHKDGDVTARRLTAFAMESRSTQLKVLAVLRARAVDDTVELPLMAIVLAVVLPLAILIQDEPDLGSPWWARTLATVILAVGIALMLVLIAGIGPILRQNKRVLASVWLPAYEEELRRRHSMKGRHARRWQRTH